MMVAWTRLVDEEAVRSLELKHILKVEKTFLK